MGHREKVEKRTRATRKGGGLWKPLSLPSPHQTGTMLVPTIAIALVSGLVPGPAVQTTSPGVPRAPAVRAALAPGANVLVLGRGPVMLLAAKLAALRGYSTTVAVAQDYGDAVDAPTLVYGTEKDADDSLLPLTLLPASPSTKGFDPTVARAAIAAADGVIVAFDDDSTLDESILNTWIPMDKSQAKHICFMSRYLNGAGMGPFAVAARKTANLDVWTASPRQVAGAGAGAGA